MAFVVFSRRGGVVSDARGSFVFRWCAICFVHAKVAFMQFVVAMAHWQDSRAKQLIEEFAPVCEDEPRRPDIAGPAAAQRRVLR